MSILTDVELSVFLDFAIISNSSWESGKQVIDWIIPESGNS